MNGKNEYKIFENECFLISIRKNICVVMQSGKIVQNDKKTLQYQVYSYFWHLLQYVIVVY